MKKHFLLLFTFLILVNCYSQTEKSKTLLGGNGNIKIGQVYNSGSNSFNINLSPKAAYFIIKKLALGLNLNIGYFKNQSIGSSNYYNFGSEGSVGPLARYYFMIRKHAIISELSYNYGWSKSSAINPGNQLYTATFERNFNQLSLGIGYCYFIKENLSIEALYQGRYVEEKETVESFNGTTKTFHSEKFTTRNYGNVDIGIFFYF